MFFLRLPRAETAGMVNRDDEAENIRCAADLGVALGPLFCDPASGILLTRAIETVSVPPEVLCVHLGEALGRLHASRNVFRGILDPEQVIGAQKRALGSGGQTQEVAALLERALLEMKPHERADHGRLTVPSHGDPSPGNCLMASDRLWLIDWEYSAMAEPAWDLAYASLENGFSAAQETGFLEAYRRCAGNRLCPERRDLEIMKAKCDAVSALWGLEQFLKGSDKTDFLAFAHARRDRALAAVRRVIG